MLNLYTKLADQLLPKLGSKSQLQLLPKLGSNLPNNLLIKYKWTFSPFLGDIINC